MPVLGIVSCEILELEFAWYMSQDPDLYRVSVIDTLHAQRFVSRLRETGMGVIDILDSTDSFIPDGENRFEVLISFLDIGLHSNLSVLLRGIREAAADLEPFSHALMLGYGLCGNALASPADILPDIDIPLFFPMDEDHPADDCIGMFIGGREAYYREQCRIAGTYFMTPGWTVHWPRLFEKEFGSMSQEMAKRVFADYSRTLLIRTPVMKEDEMTRRTEDFNRLFDCTPEICTGSMTLMDRQWKLARDHVLSIDDSVVPPSVTD